MVLGLRRLGGAIKNAVKSDAQKIPDDTIDGSTQVVRKSIGWPLAAGVGTAGVAGGGAYAYGEQQDTAQERERSGRYREYQERVAAIEAAYERGDISKSEMEARKQQAWEAYRRSLGDDTAGLTFTEFLAQLGTFQLLALSLFGSVAVYMLVPRLFAALEGTPGPEDILG